MVGRRSQTHAVTQIWVTVELLLDGSVDTERAGSGALGDSGRTAMMRAAIRGHYDVAGIMAEGRANVNVKGNDGCSVWGRAKKDGHFRRV